MNWYGSGMETAVNVPLSAIALVVAGRRGPRPRGTGVAGLRARCRLRARPVTPGLRVGCVALGAAPLRPADADPRSQRHARARPFHAGGRHRVRAQRRHRRGCPGGPARAGGPVARQRGDGPRARLECWPRVWPQTALPPVPALLRLARVQVWNLRRARSPPGVARSRPERIRISVLQTIHRKPIAWACLSRAYTRFPVDGLDSLWNANVQDHRATRVRLRELGYRYVVWHKHPELFAGGRVAQGADGVPRAAPTPASSNDFIRVAFAGEAPIRDDELTTVYQWRMTDRAVNGGL